MLQPEASGLEPKLHATGASCVLPVCLRVHTRSPALPGDRVLWPRLFRSQSSHLKAPAGARRIHWSAPTSPCWLPGSPSCLLQDPEMSGSFFSDRIRRWRCQKMRKIGKIGGRKYESCNWEVLHKVCLMPSKLLKKSILCRGREN